MDNTPQNVQQQQAPPAQTPIQSGQTPVQTTGKKKGFPWIIFIIIVAIFSVIAFGTMFFLSQPQKATFAPPFPKTSPVPTLINSQPTTAMKKETTPSATLTISPTKTSSSTATLTPSPTATAAATPTP